MVCKEFISFRHASIFAESIFSVAHKTQVLLNTKPVNLLPHIQEGIWLCIDTKYANIFMLRTVKSIKMRNQMQNFQKYRHISSS